MTKVHVPFKPVSEKAFKQQIQVDLKGADYNETLVTQHRSGIDIKPFYHLDSTTQLPIDSIPERWQAAQHIYAGEAEKANEKALDAVQRGAETIIFEIDQPSIDYKKLLEGFSKETAVQVQMRFMDSAFAKAIITHAKESEIALYLFIDPIAHLATTGNWFSSQKEDFLSHQEILNQVDGRACNLTVDTRTYQEAGAHEAQELAYMLATLSDYLNYTPAERLKNKRLNWLTSIGQDYFMEIAKLRAARILVNTVTAMFEVNLPIWITAFTSLRYFTLSDYNNNMLRSTTACMSAAIGGANTICNRAYDHFFNKENEFGTRIARNQMLLLKEESYFENAASYARGSYYIESLTQQLAQRALDIFKTIDAAGGMTKQLKEGVIQRKIKESHTAELEKYNEGTKVLVGSNKYEAAALQPNKPTELYPFLKNNPRKTLIEPVLPVRLSTSRELRDNQI